MLAQAYPVDPLNGSSWTALCLSPAKYAQRLWELTLLLACFALARAAASHAGFPRLLSLSVGLAIGATAASDLWLQWDGIKDLSALLFAPGGRRRGAFANWNHYANWLSVAGLWVVAWCLRNLSPLRGARLQPLTATAIHRADAWLLLGILAFGLWMAVGSASRGGLGALLTGLLVWLWLLGRRARAQTRWLLVSGAVLAVCVLGLLAGLPPSIQAYRLGVLRNLTPVS